jgi:hypothetical protein
MPKRPIFLWSFHSGEMVALTYFMVATWGDGVPLLSCDAHHWFDFGAASAPSFST